MDIQAIAIAATGLLGPYLAKASEAFAKQAGEIMMEKVGALYQAIKQKFQGDDYAEKTLARVEQKPDSETRMATLQEVLTEKLEEDEAFSKLLQQLIGEAKKIGDEISISGDSNIVGDHNVVQSVTAHGGNISNVTQTSEGKS